MVRFIFIIFATFLLVFKSYGQWKCDQIFLPFDQYHGFVDSQDRFLNVDIDGRPFHYQIAPVNHDMKISIQAFQSRISELDRNRFNQSMITKNRLSLDSEVFFAGLNTNESWFFYLQRNYQQLMNDLESASIQDKELSYFIIGLKQVLQKPPEIKMVSSPKEFSSENGDHRIAKTSGLPMSPIFFNIDLLDKVDSYINSYQKPIEHNQLPNFFAYANVIPFQIHVRPDLHEQLVKDRTTYNRLLKLTAIYFHELGHYLGMKDDPQHTLDRLANKAAQLLIQGYEQLSLEHRKLKGFEIVKYDLQNQSQLLIFDAFRLINLTPEIELELKNKKIQGQWKIKNLRWGERQSDNPFYWTAPEILKFDVVIQNQGKVIVMPFSYVLNLQITKQNWLSHLHRGDSVYQGPVQLKTFFSHLSYERVDDINERNTNLITQMTSIEKSDLRTGEKIKTTSVIELPSDFGEPLNAQVEFINLNSIQSGLIQRQHYLSEQNRIEYIGANRIMVHSEFNLSDKVPSGFYRIVSITLKNRLNNEIHFQPITNQNIQVTNHLINPPRLLYYGPTMTEFLGFKPYRVLDLEHRIRLDYFNQQPYGAIVPFAFFAENIKGIKDIQIDGYILGSHLDHSGTEFSYPLHIRQSSTERHPLIDRIEMKTKGNVTQILLFLKIPRKVNQDFTSEFRIQTLFLRDENNQEIFVDVPMTFGLNK